MGLTVPNRALNAKEVPRSAFYLKSRGGLQFPSQASNGPHVLSQPYQWAFIISFGLPPPILSPGHTDWDYFARSLNSVIDLRVFLKTPEDLDEAVQEFTLAAQQAARNSSRPPTPKFNTQSINLPQHIRLLLTQKRRASPKWQRTRYPSDRQHYERLAQELRCELSSFRSDTYNFYIISLSTLDRSLWDSTKRLLRSHPAPTPLRRLTTPGPNRMKPKFNRLTMICVPYFSPPLNPILFIHTKCMNFLTPPYP
ncbi:hypothetical protein AAG570_000970 [Ranatra chinensis]|uniref:Uncharacterized protein n=1 Tax=Ranatra chinensis TaxID=642074 RepID=A0ABD0YAP9_9HEMI